jgi:hypothetical protein
MQLRKRGKVCIYLQFRELPAWSSSIVLAISRPLLNLNLWQSIFHSGLFLLLHLQRGQEKLLRVLQAKPRFGFSAIVLDMVEENSLKTNEVV